MLTIRNAAASALALVLCLGLSFGANAASSPPVTGTCGSPAAPLTGVKFITALDPVSTAAFNNFAEITAGQLPFKQAKAGCVIVSYSAAASNNDSNGGLQVRVIIDSAATICEPPVTLFGRNSATGLAAAQSMTFVCKNVSAGNHVAKVQFRSTGTMGSTSTLEARSMIVHFMQ